MVKPIESSYDGVPKSAVTRFEVGIKYAEYQMGCMERSVYSDDTTAIKLWMKMSPWEKKGYIYAYEKEKIKFI